MTEKEKPDDPPTTPTKKGDGLSELKHITEGLRGMTVESDEATREAQRRRQEVERVLRNRRFWVPER